MYGKYITLVERYNDGKVSEAVTVWVDGTPDLSDKEWEKRAKAKICNMKIV